MPAFDFDNFFTRIGLSLIDPNAPISSQSQIPYCSLWQNNPEPMRQIALLTAP